MAYPRNPNNLAVDMTVQLASHFIEFMKRHYPERLGEGPIPERNRRIGAEEAAPIIDKIVQLMPSED